MTLYDFLEKIVEAGGKVEELALVNQSPEVNVDTLVHTEKLIREYADSSIEVRENYRGTRRFGFDRGSYIGEIIVSRVRKGSLAVPSSKVCIHISRPLDDR